jgi:hypothetical protein
MTTDPKFCTAAFERGVEAARTAASWAADGNTDPRGILRVLAMIEDGDDVGQYLPRRPDLSGEWADDRTPLSLAREVTALDDPSPDTIDELAEEFMRGVDETFEAACEAELRKWLP